jgi:hypothetical protein
MLVPSVERRDEQAGKAGGKEGGGAVAACPSYHRLNTADMMQ